MRPLIVPFFLATGCLNPNTDLSATEPATGTSSGDHAGTTDVTATGSTTTGDTTDVQPCDDDPACGPGETPETCPEQCSNDCGDGEVSGNEACDNGDANQTYWPNTPPDGACSETCTTTLEWCGDAQQNSNEPCDNGTNSDAPYSDTKPADTACAPSCTTVAYCGDSVQNGNEPCDTGSQSQTCEQTCTTPTCGDGITNTLAGEACDDNNTQDGDGCTADCKSLERFVFVTSVQFKGDLAVDPPNNPDNLTGLALADFRCQTLATAATLPGKYKAWLSTDTESPSTRFDTSFTGSYRLLSVDTPVVAVGWNALTAGSLDHAINTDENGTLIDEKVFTNTISSGESASGDHCMSWTSSLDIPTIIGKSSAKDATWTKLELPGICSDPRRLYCFQDL